MKCEMKKLRSEEAGVILRKAFKLCREHPTYRMGQAICNLLPDGMAKHFDGAHVNTKEIGLCDTIWKKEHTKWYNSHDAVWCIERFYRVFVEEIYFE